KLATRQAACGTAGRRAANRWSVRREPPGTCPSRMPLRRPARFQVQRSPSPGRLATLLLLSVLLLFLLVTEPAGPGAGLAAAWCRERAGRRRRAGGGRGVRSRYAGAMLLHAFGSRAGAGDVLAGAAGGLPAAARLLAAVSACIGLGY